MVMTSINGDIDEYEFSGVDKMHVVNIVKEALNNAMKHAQASLVRVSWRCEEGWHELTVRDDGRGFTANTVDGSRGSGLDIMEERVSLLGGHLEVDSALGEYTQITLRFPVRQGGCSDENNDSR